jgi:hypothetical protein
LRWLTTEHPSSTAACFESNDKITTDAAPRPTNCRSIQGNSWRVGDIAFASSLQHGFYRHCLSHFRVRNRDIMHWQALRGPGIASEPSTPTGRLFQGSLIPALFTSPALAACSLQLINYRNMICMLARTYCCSGAAGADSNLSKSTTKILMDGQNAKHFCCKMLQQQYVLGNRGETCLFTNSNKGTYQSFGDGRGPGRTQPPL